MRIQKATKTGRFGSNASLAIWLVLTSPLAAHAQTLPDAGAVRQQIEREIAAPPPGTNSRRLPAPTQTPVAPPGGASVDVRAFRFQGNTRLSDEQLAQVLLPWTGRTLDYAGLQAAAAAVGEAYRAAGWVVRTVLPRQEITGGVVTLDLIEARLGAIRMEEPQSPRVPLSLIRDTIEQGLQAGALLNMADVDRGLMLADDLPGVIVIGDLQEGAAEGTSDLAVRLGNEPPLMGDITLDNTGSLLTGAERLAIDVAWLSPLHQGDLLRTTLAHTRGSDYLRGAYSWPVGAQGLRIGVNTSVLDYRLTEPQFAALDAHGRSSSVGLEANYPLVRSRASNLYATAGLDYRSFDNHANGGVTSNYKVRNVILGLSGNHFDDWGGGGVNAGSIQLVNTLLDLDGSPSQQADAASVRAAGQSTKLRYSVSRQQTLNRTFSLFATLSGQWADRNQDSSEKFYLGGANGVRAYPANEGGGAIGQVLNLELRAVLPQGVVVTAFYDWGHARVNVDNQFAGAPAINSYSLKGAGLSVSTRFQKIGLRATWSRRLGANPNATPAGMDQDGRRVLNRLWLSANYVF